MKKVIAVTGDFYHQKAWADESLQRAAQPLIEAGEISLTYIDAEQLIETLQDKPDVVILFKENRLNPQDEHIRIWMDAEAEEQIAKYVREGGVWLGWHAGLASYPEDGAYVDMLRGHFVSHPKEHQIVRYEAVEGTGIGHPQQPFSFLDEHYFVSVRESETEVFLRSSSIDGESIGGWRHSFGQGKVLCLTPAHLQEGLNAPAFTEVFTRSLAWCVN